MAGKQEEQGQLCHLLRSHCPLAVAGTQLHVVGTTGWDHQVEEGQVFPPPPATVVHVALLRCGHWAGDGGEGRPAGSHLPGAGEGESPGPTTFSAEETIWGRLGLSVHSSRKAFILHIWTRTLQNKNLE